MRRISFSKISIFLIYCCSIYLCVIHSDPVDAAEKMAFFSADHSERSAVLLTNQEYLPELLKAIDEAKKEIIMSFFLFKVSGHKNSFPDRVLDHLAKATRKGIKVIVILENSGGQDQKIDAENGQTKKLLEDKGMEVHLDSPRKTTHTKLVVIDQKWILLGSHNLTQSALKYNNEISILLDSPALAKEAHNYMLAIIKEAK